MAIRIPIITDFNGEGLKKTFEEFKKLESNSQKAAFAVNKAFVPATAALAGLAAGLVVTAKAAAADQAAQAQLARQLIATTGATDNQIQANEEFISTLSMSAAVADDELRPALASLVRGTGDLAKAQDALKTVLDVSAATGKGVQEVADSVSKAYGGNTKAIKQLSPELYQLIKDGASADQVMQSLSQTFGGAAVTSANSAQGQFKKLSIAMDEAKEAIGAAVLPLVNALVPALIAVANWAQKNTPIVVGFATAIGVFASAIVAAKVAMVAWRAAAVITQAINYALATSFTAVQVSTGVGIATVAAGIAAMAVYVTKMKGIQQDLGQIESNAKMIGPPLTEQARKHLEDLQKQSTSTGGAIDAMKQKIEEARKELDKQFSDALDKAKGKLEEAQKAYDDFKTTVSESVTGEFSISGAADAAKEAGTTILDQLNQQAMGAKAFGKQVEQLLRMGISEEALRKVLEAGQEAGSAIATELINGGSEAILGPNGINQLVSDLNLVAEAVGILGADQFYKAGVTQGQAMVKGITDVIAQLEKKLKNKNLTLADIKGIGASFSNSLSIINPSSVSAQSLSIEERAGIAAGRGGDQYNINISGGMATSAEIGRIVIDNIKAANRAYGPAAIEVL